MGIPIVSSRCTMYSEHGTSRSAYVGSFFLILESHCRVPNITPAINSSYRLRTRAKFLYNGVSNSICTATTWNHLYLFETGGNPTSFGSFERVCLGVPVRLVSKLIFFTSTAHHLQNIVIQTDQIRLAEQQIIILQSLR